MSTLLDHWDRRYTDRVRLLVDILPVLAQELHFAESSCTFLRSVESEQPDFGLIGLAHAAELPGVRRKLHNLAKRTDAKRVTDRGLLEETLERIARAK